MAGEPEKVEENDGPDRWTLIRDVAVFQVKLLFDGFRDLLLLPVSLVAGILSLIRGEQDPARNFMTCCALAIAANAG